MKIWVRDTTGINSTCLNEGPDFSFWRRENLETKAKIRASRHPHEIKNIMNAKNNQSEDIRAFLILINSPTMQRWETLTKQKQTHL